MRLFLINSDYELSLAEVISHGSFSFLLVPYRIKDITNNKCIGTLHSPYKFKSNPIKFLIALHAFNKSIRKIVNNIKPVSECVFFNNYDPFNIVIAKAFKAQGIKISRVQPPFSCWQDLTVYCRKITGKILVKEFLAKLMLFDFSVRLFTVGVCDEYASRNLIYDRIYCLYSDLESQCHPIVSRKSYSVSDSKLDSILFLNQPSTGYMDKAQYITNMTQVLKYLSMRYHKIYIKPHPRETFVELRNIFSPDVLLINNATIVDSLEPVEDIITSLDVNTVAGFDSTALITLRCRGYHVIYLFDLFKNLKPFHKKYFSAVKHRLQIGGYEVASEIE